jgi:hypothetical protein
MSVPGGPANPYLIGIQEKRPQSSLYEDFKKTMFGGSLGLGVESSSLLPIALSAEFRYNIDFSDSFNNGFVKVRNNTFDVWLGVAF